MKPMFNPSLMCMDLLNIKEQLQILNTRLISTMWISWTAIM